MNIAVPAAAGMAAALIDASVAPHFGFAGHPHAVLVLAIVVAVASGLETAVVCAVAGGIALDVVAARPVGETAFALLLVVAAARPATRVPLRFRALLTVGLTPLASAGYSLVLIAILSALGVSLPGPTLSQLPPGIAYDTAIVAVATAAQLELARRRAPAPALA